MIIGEVESRQIIYLSKTVEGKKHDKKIADEETIEYPAGTVLQQDTGFQGYAPTGVTVKQPKKKPRGGETGERRKSDKSGIKPGASGHRTFDQRSKKIANRQRRNEAES